MAEQLGTAIVLAPGDRRSMVGYFDQLSAAIRAGVADDRRLDEIALRHGMEVTGPVPEGYL